jgi:hypothetical protein
MEFSVFVPPGAAVGLVLEHEIVIGVMRGVALRVDFREHG